MPTVRDLGEFIRQKYPEYQKEDPVKLGRWAKNNFEEYSQFTDDEPPEIKDYKKDAKNKSITAKAFDALNYALNVTASTATKKGYAPLAEKLPISSEAKGNIKQLEQEKGFVFHSDV